MIRKKNNNTKIDQIKIIADYFILFKLAKIAKSHSKTILNAGVCDNYNGSLYPKRAFIIIYYNYG